MFTPGQRAVESGDIERLDRLRVLERFKQLVTLAGEGRQYKIPGARYKQDAILPRENLNPWQSVYDVIFTIRAHMGKAAALKDLERWVDDNSELFPKIDTSAITQNWQDPKPILSDLAVLRLVRLQGYPGARDWTREHRPHKKCIKPLKRDYERYSVEGKKPKGNRPLYERQREFENAVRRARNIIASP